jgi:hypothetical protein
MGMNVSGLAPRSEIGEHFDRSVWWWQPLWTFCEQVAPDIIPEDNHGHFNDDWGLDDPGALALAGRLQETLDDGYVAYYEAERKAQLEALPDEPCDFCDATGKRTWSSGESMCERCKGTGIARPWITNYPFCEQNVRDFAAFLRECGGFAIT